jgi:hypothetical protein
VDRGLKVGQLVLEVQVAADKYVPQKKTLSSLPKENIQEISKKQNGKLQWMGTDNIHVV